MEFSIRTAREHDAEPMAGLLNSIIREGTYTVMDELLSVDDQIDFIRGFPERGVFNVAVSNDGRILGIQDVMPVSAASKSSAHRGEISTFVAPEFQGKGIGRSLSMATFGAAREKGLTKLCATIRADNPGAIAFYLRQGFRVIGTARNHACVGGRYIDEILAEKLLD